MCPGCAPQQSDLDDTGKIKAEHHLLRDPGRSAALGQPESYSGESITGDLTTKAR
jgi:hypothetical protein